MLRPRTATTHRPRQRRMESEKVVAYVHARRRAHRACEGEFHLLFSIDLMPQPRAFRALPRYRPSALAGGGPFSCQSVSWSGLAGPALNSSTQRRTNFVNRSLCVFGIHTWTGTNPAARRLSAKSLSRRLRASRFDSSISSSGLLTRSSYHPGLVIPSRCATGARFAARPPLPSRPDRPGAA